MVIRFKKSSCFLLAGEALPTPPNNSNGTQNRDGEILRGSDQSRNGQHVDEGKKIYSVLFASNINSLTPWPPNYMLCRCCVLCSLNTDKKNQHCWGREGDTGKGERNISKTLENCILLQSDVSTLLSLIVACFFQCMQIRGIIIIYRHYMHPPNIPAIFSEVKCLSLLKFPKLVDDFRT